MAGLNQRIEVLSSKTNFATDNADVLGRLVRTELKRQFEPFLNEVGGLREQIDQIATAVSTNAIDQAVFQTTVNEDSDDAHDKKSGPVATPQSSKTSGKGFWNSVVKPAFPEALTDIGIIKSALTIQSNTKQDIHDRERYPEVAHVADVRRGLDLAPPEQRFLIDRKVKVRNAFARYLGLNPADIHPDDIPTVGFGGSGGGFRAMIGVLGYAEEMKRTGLWDVLTSVAGVSVACWALSAS